MKGCCLMMMLSEFQNSSLFSLQRQSTTWHSQSLSFYSQPNDQFLFIAELDEHTLQLGSTQVRYRW